MNPTFLLDGSKLTPDDVVRISRDFNQFIDLTEETWNKIKKARSIVQDMVSQEGKVVYGINTGFGNFANRVIPKLSLHQLQTNLILSHSVAVGKPLEHHQARALLLLRINTLAKSRSGITQTNLKKLIIAFNKKFISYVPEKGTVGASGDLAPLSHFVLGLIGQGYAWDWDLSEYVPSQKILDKLGLEKLILLEKQGLALINGTQFMSAIACQALILAQNVIKTSQSNLSLFMELFAYPQKLLSEVYENQIRNPTLKLLIKKFRQKLFATRSQLHKTRSSQINYDKEMANSIRYSLDTLAAAYDSLKFVRKITFAQINGTTDNPLVFSVNDGFQIDSLVSAGNFHGEYIAKAVDILSIAINSLGKYADRRTERYINGKISYMPLFLVEPELSGINSGMMILQYTSAAITSENKLLSKPASVDSVPTSAGQQDHVSMGGYGARKCLQLVKNVGKIFSIELMCASQAVGLLNLQPCKQNQIALQKVREQFPFKKQDYFYGQKIQKVADIVFQGISTQNN